jgi:ribosomal protein S18 acetylase RimI-like enzyme
MTESLPEGLLSRIEDAGLNASAPPQQRWMDGWLLRFSPGKAQRARCINAVAVGRLPVAEKLRRAEAAYAEAGMPLVLRITPFTLPVGLDADLAARGFASRDDTRVMVCTRLSIDAPTPLPPGTHWQALAGDDYAEAVGLLRGSPALQRVAHAERLRHSPVPYRGFVIRRDDDGAVLACGQFAMEAELVGLYDVFTRDSERGRGLARGLCLRLLAMAASMGARVGYLQVEADNGPARHIYRGLGFHDGYAYHYRGLEQAGG